MRDIQTQRAQFELGVENTRNKINENKRAIKEQWNLQTKWQGELDAQRAIPIKERTEIQRQSIRDLKKRITDSKQLVLDLRRENRGMLNTITPEMLENQRTWFDLEEARTKSSASLSTRKMLYDYENYMGNMESQPLNLLPENYGTKMAEDVEKNYWALADIVKNTDALPSLGEKIDHLLSLK